MDLYKLNGNNTIKCDNIEDYCYHRKIQNKIVAKTNIKDAYISTVFLGMDYSLHGNPPLLFETMIFGGKHDDYTERYETWEQAVLGHEIAIKLVNEDE